MDIRSGSGYPSSALSNFAPHKFTIDGIECNSMEGFLQSLKFKEPAMQKHVCSLVGRAAKAKGRNKNWKQSQTLYWQGKEYKRDSLEYQTLLRRAYSEMAKQNDGFCKALIASGSSTLTHSMGRSNIHETVLTEREFCRILEWIRYYIMS